MQKQAHFHPGLLPVAFVFSVPGTKEKDASVPVAGDTGDNLGIALGHLARCLPHIFESANRYDYRITNSFAEPHSKKIGTSHTEAKASQIRNPDNVRRVIEELKGCKLAILCGRRAQLLTAEIELAGIKAIHAWHTGNRALINKYTGARVAAESTPNARRQVRALLWAKDLETKIAASAA
jgi:uracil-DNA glycosylase